MAGILQGSQQSGRAGADADVLNCRRARQQALGRTQQGAPVGALVIVSGLERPDPLVQPGQQPAAFRQAPEDRLPEVDMALDEAGE